MAAAPRRRESAGEGYRVVAFGKIGWCGRLGYGEGVEGEVPWFGEVRRLRSG